MSKPLPLYRCHKHVHALKIKDIQFHSDGSVLIIPEDGYAAFVKDDTWVFKNKPKVGGYWVQYAGGYESYSPPDPFESGYTLIPDDDSEIAGQHHPV